ncbi:hypothetical protein ANCCEY_08965 [Ancylostoma ceylanicum]|uniref:SCP domain-containing protein n=1 Tax=Ancylostoma ceylanicum TaxID=53326 RepID=A0A0D6LLA8_9BILA|nr:hypothetical protein ANCCEY_08965 [Ancylostoma ceylanicum]
MYDCDIEESAMRHAVGCRWGHSAQHERKDLGENLYYSGNRQMNKVNAAEDACKLWFGELAERGVGQEDNVLTQEVWNKPGQIGHYTQGNFRGNWIGDPIYDTGNPCTTDDDCMCTNCRCSKEEALCIIQ